MDEDETESLRRIAVRLFALETVMQQLLIRLALRNDDPGRWVAERRMLALHAMADAAENEPPEFAGDLFAATAELFDPVQDCVRRAAG